MFQACFNSRAHKGRDYSMANNQNNVLCFNSRAHKGRDWDVRLRRIKTRCFNSRAHKGRDMPVLNAYKVNNSFQFTRPQGARPDFPELEEPVLSVSIHAPTRGATAPMSAPVTPPYVSIHAPTRGATF